MKRKLTRQVCALVVCAGTVALAQNDWRTYGNDPGHMRFSPLTQITPQNVQRLVKAWEFDTKTRGRKWEATPLVIDGRMFVTLQNGGVVALEPETGRELWRFEVPVRGRSVRAVSYWPGDRDTRPRLLYGATDKLWALDPGTGEPILSFGNQGAVDIHPGHPPVTAPRGPTASDSDDRPGPRGGFGGSGFSVSSPPAIYRNLAIVGGSLAEDAFVGPPGDIQAFDIKTGKRVWRFHVVPQPGERHFGTWGDGWKHRGGPSTWGLFTVDTERGLVFIPTGNPGGSFYGGDRPGDNLYAVSVVALDAATGEYRWHFQTTRHDIWDADLGAAPALIEVVRDGRRIPAVAQVTKMGGMLFLLDRLTGKPLFDVEDRPVPKSNVPGEVTSPTQPFPKKPEPWSRLAMTKADITTVTPESHKYCSEWWERERMSNNGPYTPYGTDGVTVAFSGTIGGGNWGGVAFNPQLGYLFVNTSNLATLGRMVPDPRNPGRYRNELAYTRFWDENKYPCQQPPWGELVAVNVNTGDIVWKVPLGVYPELLARGVPPTGTPNLGGPIATASGLVFIGATKDARFRAFDAKTGKELWYAQLEAPAVATPMTFLGRDGTQYVVIAAGGPGDTDRGGTELYPQKLVAFALADRVRRVETIGADAPPAVFDRTVAAAGKGARPDEASRVPDDEAGRLTMRACTACHALDRDVTVGRTRAAWEAVVRDMVALGAEITAEEVKVIVDYLSRTYPPQ